MFIALTGPAGCQSLAYLLCLKKCLMLAPARCFQVVHGIKPERALSMLGQLSQGLAISQHR